MRTKSFSAAVLLALSLATLVGCSSNQSIKTSDGRTIVTDGKPQIDSDTGLVSYRDAQTGKTEQINRDQINNMSELDNQLIPSWI
ncbi:YgdI/YgdR family lipoprotein [Pantoea ananatis]